MEKVQWIKAHIGSQLILLFKKLPIIFICENNQYAIYSHQKNRMAKIISVKKLKPWNKN